MKNLASVRQPVRPNPMRYRATPFASKGGASFLSSLRVTQGYPQGPIHTALLSRESVFPSTRPFPFSSRPMPAAPPTATTYSVSPELLLLIGGIVPDWATKLTRDNPDDAAYMMFTLAALAVLSFVAAWKADSRYKKIQALNKQLQEGSAQLQQLKALLQNHRDQIEGFTALERVGEEALAFLSTEEKHRLAAMLPPEALYARSLHSLLRLLDSSPHETALLIIKLREKLAEKLASPRETSLVKAMQEIIRKMKPEEREALAAALYELAEDPEALLEMFFSDAWQATVRSFPQRISERVLPRTLLVKTARSTLQDVREATARIVKNDEKELLLILATDPLPTLAEGAFRKVSPSLTREDLNLIVPQVHHPNLLWSIANHSEVSPSALAGIFNQLIKKHEVVIREATGHGELYSNSGASVNEGERWVIDQERVTDLQFYRDELTKVGRILAARTETDQAQIITQLNPDLAQAIKPYIKI